jgi:outer membrane protein assembly factor BamA
VTRNPREDTRITPPDRLVAAFGLFMAAALALLSTGCVKKLYTPERCDRPDKSGCIIEDVRVSGSQAAAPGAAKEKIATAETDHPFMGVFENVPILSVVDRLLVEYERLDPFVLERDLARMERYYRSLGYYEAHVRAGRVLPRPKQRVAVEILVDEGAPVKIKRVRIDWKDVPEHAQGAKARAQKSANRLLKEGANFEEEPFEEAKKRILRILTGTGYAYARVEGKAEVDLAKHEASIALSVDLGPRCKFGPIKIEGLGKLPEKPLRAVMDLKEGAWFSTEALDDAQVELGNFGVFGAIDVIPEFSPPDKPHNPVIPVVFRVQPASLRTLKLGGGAEIGSRVEGHFLSSWEHRNFLGGLRHFTVEARPGAVLYPLNITNWTPANGVQVLPEARLRAELAQPAFLEARTKGIVSVSGSAYRLITSDQSQNDQIIVGYLEFAGKTGLERQFWGRHITLGGYLQVQHDRPFSYADIYNLYKNDEGAKTSCEGGKPLVLTSGTQALDCKGYRPLTIPYLQSVFTLDLRENARGKLDPLNPHQGFYLSTDVQWALPAVANRSYGSVWDFRLRLDARGYIPISRKVTLAMRFAPGLLVTKGYGDAIDLNKSCAASDCGSDIQILQFRGFFSGGANSNRGYPYNGAGPHMRVPFLAGLSSADATQANLAIAVGGATIWEGSVELRFPIVDKLGATLFFEGSNVGLKLEDFFRSFGAPHFSTGFGLRYLTPVGPLRADFGVRIPCLQVLSVPHPCRPVYDPNLETQIPAATAADLARYLGPAFGTAGTVFSLPLAISIAIGEAY